MQRLTLRLLLLLCFTQLINYTSAKNAISNTVAHVLDNELISIRKDEYIEPTIEELSQPVIFTPSGITCFINHRYNVEKYAQEVLPELPFNHLEQFLVHGLRTNQPRSYTKAVFRLFEKKFKAVPYINAAEFESFVQRLPELIKLYLAPNQAARKRTVKMIMRSEMETNFDAFKQNPDAFLDNLAEKIVTSEQADIHEVTLEHLQYNMAKFIDTCLNKIIWSPSDKDDVWANFIKIGKGLNTLKEQGVVRSTDDLDDCLWTLTTRFCLFLSLSGADLPVEFYEKACKEIHRGIACLDNIEEQEDLMLTKRACVHDAILKNVAKSYENARPATTPDH